MKRNAWRRVLLVVSLMGLTNCTTGIGHNAPDSITPVESITATSGTPQSHSVNGAFGAALVATVTTNGTPASGVVVTFTAPSTGASATFSNTTSTTASATTNDFGVATSPALTANGSAGTYTITATILGVPTPAIFTLTNTTGAPATIVATSGTPQSAPINAAFAAPLVATVLDSGNNPVGGALVTFTAPATGASGTFANGTATETDTTNASGRATSTPFTANGTAGADTVTATVAGVSTPASFNLNNASGAAATVAPASGNPQSAVINTPFAAPLVAMVVDSSSNPVSGVAVTFTAPAATGASGTFANGTATETDTTNASGLAVSTTFTANGTTGGPYTVTATIAGASAPANFSLTNRAVGSTANTYVFYLSGQESSGVLYALAGAVQIDPTGKVITGEQDYNDGSGLTFPGVGINGGSLSVNGTTGQGTLTLITNNTSLGVNGTETLGVQFANSNHALVIQFDRAATSSGSMDLQAPPAALSGGYAFTLSGFENAIFGAPVGFGGVFSIAGATLQNGFFDVNDDGTVTTKSPLSGTLSTFDALGRGTITSNLNYGASPIVLNYYIVGPEAIRIIDVDTSDTAVGSAIGQGANATSSSNASLGNSVFGIGGSPDLVNYATAGVLVPSPTAGTFTGTADDNEVFSINTQVAAASISGTYSIDSNGYGNLAVTSGNLGDVTVLGVYLTDPNLNLIDPNNTSGVLGGALVADMGLLAGGSGVLVPQTNTSTSSFTGNYAFGAQGFNVFEYDFVGQGSVTGSVFSGTGLLNDPLADFGSIAADSGVAFSGTAVADTTNVGRYTMSPLNVTINGTATPLNAVIYQASGGELFWIDEDPSTVFFGSMQLQGSLTGIPGTTTVLTETITATSGTPQSAIVNTAFAAPLVATVTTGGSPTSGVVVTFTAPTTGASGTFAGGGGTATATTNASGIATSPVFTANGMSGAYTVTAMATGVPSPANFSLTNTAAPIETITSTSGTPQSATVHTAFTLPLVATVTTVGSPTSGVVVAFTAPATGASGTFAGGGTTATATTDASGVATSQVFTANGTTGAYSVTAAFSGAATPAAFSLTNTPAAVEAITATSGTPQSAVINTAFTAPLVATVTTGGSATSGVIVTFAAPATGASGTFAGGSKTATATTDASGIATSPVFTANGTTGSYTIAASVVGVATPADFSLTNTSASTNYVFYLSGQEVSGPTFYALVGSVEIDSSGKVVGGKQDYNDGFAITSPEPLGDKITGGKLAVNTTTGQGTLTLITDNTSVGVGGAETLGVQFVNGKHALIIEFDGVATSSGSIDLQTLPSTLTGGYAFTLDGTDNGLSPVGFGGAFSITSGTNLEDGVVDTNDAGNVTLAAPLSGTLTPVDSFGRGTITSTLNYGGSPIALNYYVVGPEAIRIIDVDTTDSAMGSALGQGVNATSAKNSSLGKSIFGLNGSPVPANYAAAGMFSTSNTSSSVADFSGVADVSELAGIQLPKSAISGTYSIASNGYGNFTITSSSLGDVSTLGIYMTDPSLNLSDPNNTTSGLGGALVADMDPVLAGGTGVVVPQTSTSKTSFTGKYDFGAQAFFTLFEFDFVGQGSVTGGALSGTGMVSDPFDNLGGSTTNSGVTFAGTPLADSLNPGRYSMFSTNVPPNPLKVTISRAITPFDVVIYQASGGELFWLDEDPNSQFLFLGTLQQQGSLSGIPAAVKP